MCRRDAMQTLMSSQVASAMDKLSTRERFLNLQCEHLTAEYREAKEHLSQLQMQFNQQQDAATELENELARVAQVKRNSLHSHMVNFRSLIKWCLTMSGMVCFRSKKLW